MEKLLALWRQYLPEMRFMQAIVDFQTWKKSDCFYLLDQDLIPEFEMFCKYMTLHD